MTIHIIHLPSRTDRLAILERELLLQSIENYKIWEGISDEEMPCRGICKAHKRIVEYAQKNKLSEIVIAEDDLKFTSLGAYRFFLQNKPSDFDMYLAGINHGVIGDDNTVEHFLGTTFYIISERFYNCFLSLPENRHLDRALKGKGKFVVCNPFTVIPQDGYSDNLKLVISYEYCLRGRNLYKQE
jgi:hypothetical protein